MSGTRVSARLRMREFVASQRPQRRICPILARIVSMMLECIICQDVPLGGRAVEFCTWGHVTCNRCAEARRSGNIFSCGPLCDETEWQEDVWLGRLLQNLHQSGQLPALTRPNELRDLVKSYSLCSGCQFLLMPPVSFCSEGHLTCGYCHNELVRASRRGLCPICRKALRAGPHPANQLLIHLGQQLTPPRIRGPRADMVMCPGLSPFGEVPCSWRGPLHPNLGEHLSVSNCAVYDRLFPNAESGRLWQTLRHNWKRGTPLAFKMNLGAEGVAWVFIMLMWHDRVFKLIPYTHQESPFAGRVIKILAYDEINPHSPCLGFNGRINIIQAGATTNLHSILEVFAKEGCYLALTWDQVSEILNETCILGDILGFRVCMNYGR